MSVDARVITLLTDFGTGDGYAGAVKGVLFATCPGVTVVDLTHDVPPGDVRAGAFALERAASTFPAGTVHLAVVDPGVGTERRGLVVEAAGALFVGPDNGLLSRAAPAPRRIWQLDRPQWFRRPVASTFHGRDVFAPIAARLAAGLPPGEVATPVHDMVELHVPAPVLGPGGSVDGEVVHVDRFGNLVTNVSRRELELAGGSAMVMVTIERAGAPLRLVATYGSADPGELVGLVGSSGLLEIAINGGSARDALNVGAGARVRVSRARA